MLRHIVDALRHQYLGAIALFLALGGTSYALALDEGSVSSREIRDGGVRSVDIGRHAVKSRHIARHAVTARNIGRDAVTPAKIAPNAVSSEEVEDGSLLATDFRPGQIPKGEKGDRGPQGLKGAKGDKGDTGASGSPDTPAQVLDKLKTVDGAGSGLDADLLAGSPLSDLQRRVTGTCGAGQYVQSVGADGSVSCGTDANSGGDITGVTAGTGLTGGATAGNATLSVAVPLQLTQGNAGSTNQVESLTQAGIGNGLSINMSNTGNGARGIDIAQSGVGPALFATSNGNGLWGITSSISSAGVIGDNPRGEAVVGRQTGACENPPATCNGIGAVVGRHDGLNGYGVRGFVTDPGGGIGVLGQTGVAGGTGTGVRGENVNAANTGDGVLGVTNGTGAGVHGRSSTGLAGLFDGNVTINGNLTVTGTKSGFRIDDPRDPAHRTLSHTPVESDGFTVVYTGNVRTGRDGRATVRLPAYATTLAGHWRYQLTPIGQFGQAIVAREVRHGRFVIRTEHANTKVSWSVTGLRRDAFARAHPFHAVQTKVGAERGRYLHPELYGEPASKSVIRPVKKTTARAAVAATLAA